MGYRGRVSWNTRNASEAVCYYRFHTGMDTKHAKHDTHCSTRKDTGKQIRVPLGGGRGGVCGASL